jgi:putative transposase
MRRCYVYPVPALDWSSRRVLTWQLSNTVTADFCAEALDMAKRCYGTPEIVNIDQNSEFTSEAFAAAVLDSAAQLSMDAKGALRDNISIERFWRTERYEEV